VHELPPSMVRHNTAAPAMDVLEAAEGA
jgi:hypothetical protein